MPLKCYNSTHLVACRGTFDKSTATRSSEAWACDISQVFCDDVGYCTGLLRFAKKVSYAVEGNVEGNVGIDDENDTTCMLRNGK
jgi:hypothetical protein